MSETIESIQQAERIRMAIDEVIALGPAFIRGDITVGVMTDAMLASVADYQRGEEVAGREVMPLGPRSTELFPVFQEFVACGGGYQAGRCDADCVVRTMTHLVDEYGTVQN